MIFRIYVDDINWVTKKLQSTNNELTKHRWKNSDQRTDLDVSKLSVSELDALQIVLETAHDDKANARNGWYAPIFRKFMTWRNLANAEDDGKPVKKLELLPAAIKAVFKNRDRKWIFKQMSDESVCPYFISEVKYHKAYYDSYGRYHPARVEFEADAYMRGEIVHTTYTWYARHIGKPAMQILSESGLMPETESGVASYLEEIKKYLLLQGKVGLQASAFGTATTVDTKSYWSSTKSIAMVRDGMPTKVVLDDLSDEEKGDNRRGSRSSSNTYVTDDFWGEIPNRNGLAALDPEERDEAALVDEDTKRVELPIHPYLRAFDLDKHQWVTLHSGHLKDYDWDKSLMDKLVIKDTDKELIGLLMNQTGAAVEDIVKGKMAGVIVLATGKPGIGKTLTAEVFSEMIEKPLYTVQCSQLGLNIDEIEKNLKSILSRASRWGAILLIDEADVYIRERGEDIEQNAIVGVFLRLIEYYRGVLFMTSNRGDIIDDAIISRATAWIKYDLPDTEQLGEIWKVLGKQYGAELTDKDVKKLTGEESLSRISGRTVRNLLKLARLLKGPDGKITPETIIEVSRYQALT